VPDPAATSTAGTDCSGIGLASSSLPTGWSYHCAASSTYRDVNGEGWLPVDFTKVSSGSPLGSLPADPVNTTSTGLYYAYTVRGDPWELTANMESTKYQMGGSDDVESKDGGQYPDLYEVGTDLSLMPIDYNPSLVGYWKLDEGSGSTAYDASGHGNNGTWYGTQAGTSGYYSAGHNQTWAGYFDGSTDYVNVTSSPSFSFGGSLPFTVIVWVNGSNFSGNTPTALAKGNNGACIATYVFFASGSNADFETNSTGVCTGNHYASFPITTNTWYQIAGVYDGTSMFAYENGVLEKTLNISATSPLVNSSPLWIGKGYSGTVQFWPGLIDDVRVYNRALSAAEIQAIYNASR
jgi:Concanavalin A-like lectin/glucanases superfamily